MLPPQTQTELDDAWVVGLQAEIHQPSGWVRTYVSRMIEQVEKITGQPHLQLFGNGDVLEY
jgi:hypothetical protein